MKGVMNGKHGGGLRGKNPASRRNGLIATSVAVAAAIVLVGFATLAYNKPFTPIATRTAPEPAASTRKNTRAGALAVQTDTPAVEVEVVVLTPDGFQPIQINRPVGPFILQVDNRTGIEEIEVTIQGRTLNGPHRGIIDSATIGGGQIDWNNEYDLAPDKYVLGVTGHPDWVCPMTIVNLN